ncbi:MAG TPA: hypothetical protein IAB97_05870, partial [Candidatus Choladousia intestinipullorum]|nr:hypothetical protein [Candidatus Choladousia intestinipullorum]
MGIGKRRMAFLLAAALAFTSIDSVSLMAGAEEVLLVEDEGQVLQQEGANQQDAGQGSSGGQTPETGTVLQSEKTENLTTETTAETIMETDTDAGNGTSGAAGETPESSTETAEASGETMPETGTEAQTGPASEPEEVLLPETQTEGSTDIAEVTQETDSQTQTEEPQIVEDGGLIIEEVTVLGESAELAAGTLPWDGAKVTPVTMDSPVEVAAGTSPSDLQWYSFTPDEAGEYVFSAVGSTATVHSISMYDADGSLLSGWTSRLKYSLTGGVTYFYSVMNNMDAYTVLVERPQSVTSASVEPEKTELINYLDSLWIGDVTLTYADGSTFEIDKNTTEDRYGNLLYVVFYSGEVQAGTCALNQPFSLANTGTYQVELLYNGQPVSERYDITVVNPEEAVLPQISPQGETAVTSGTDMSDRIWYTFTPQKTGRYSFNVANGMSGLPPCEIVKMDSTGVVSASLSDTLESGVTYYLRFYGGLYDSLTGSYVYDFTLSVKEAVDIESAEIISGKTTFINGLENVINHNTKLQITYSDQSTREVTVSATGTT